MLVHLGGRSIVSVLSRFEILWIYIIWSSGTLQLKLWLVFVLVLVEASGCMFVLGSAHSGALLEVAGCIFVQSAGIL